MNSKAKQRAWAGPASAAKEAAAAGAAQDRAPTPLTAPPARLAFAAAAGDVGARLDRFLGQAAGERRLALSRTRLRALIEAGHVKVDGVPIRDPASRLTDGAQIEVEAPPPAETTLAAEALPLDILFEDAHLLVLDKPAGLVVHPAAGHERDTLVNALIAHCGESLSGIGGVRRPGIVHRLDKDTSGLLVVAKSDAAHQGLSALFADHGRTGSLVREYQALVWGTPPAPSGTIDAPLGRHPRQREKRAVAPIERGRHAVTHWRLRERLGPASLICCRLETGRTHQNSRPFRPYRPSDRRRRRLWRRVQEQGGAIVGGGTRRPGAAWPPGSARREARLHPSNYRRAVVI